MGRGSSQLTLAVFQVLAKGFVMVSSWAKGTPWTSAKAAGHVAHSARQITLYRGLVKHSRKLTGLDNMQRRGFVCSLELQVVLL